MTSGEIANVCSMVQEEMKAAEERQSLLHNHLIEELSQSLRSLQIHPGLSERIINESITRGQIRYLRKINEESLPEIHDANSVRKYYTGKGISMVKQLPRPEVQIKTLEGSREYAFIDPVELVNHVFAVGVDCHYYRAGYDEDWDPNKVDDKRSPYMKQVLDANFFRTIHAKMKVMVENNEIPPETRVVIGRGWSDGFDANKITSNNDFNSLQ
eukprot:scaffold136592_cov28-Cyclotella_meneghiniana.AAC.1